MECQRALVPPQTGPFPTSHLAFASVVVEKADRVQKKFIGLKTYI